jgi:hypothetical protein
VPLGEALALLQDAQPEVFGLEDCGADQAGFIAGDEDGLAGVGAVAVEQRRLQSVSLA